MQKLYRFSFILLTSLATFGCGGGGGKTAIELGGDDVEVEGGVNYKCAIGASSMNGFSLLSTASPADFSKKTGLNLERYFYNITTGQENTSETEIRNKYILRYEKNYIFGQASGFEVTAFDPVVVQSLLDGWYYLGDDLDVNNPVSSNSEWDDDIPRYAFTPAQFFGRVGDLLPAHLVAFADLGDTVSYTNTHQLGFEIKSSCVINKKFIPEKLTRDYGEVISLECTNYQLSDPDTTTGDQLFSGSKVKLYLAKDIGIVSNLTDAYQTVLSNTQETQRRCLQAYSELVETKTVPRVYTPGLGTIVP